MRLMQTMEISDDEWHELGVYWGDGLKWHEVGRYIRESLYCEMCEVPRVWIIKVRMF